MESTPSLSAVCPNRSNTYNHNSTTCLDQTDTGRINYMVNDINGTQEATTPTTVTACHDGKYFYLNFSMTDTDVISTLSGCNSPLYTEDAVEFFVSAQDYYPNDYFEFEISPKGELFFADINNPNLDCSKFNTEYRACNTVTYGAKLTSVGWDAYLKADLTILGRGQVPKILYGNFFRIDKSRNMATKYMCWQSTLSNPPCFHKPRYFGEIHFL